MSAFVIEGSSVLITGASAGIGREFARHLATRASSLILVARRLERLEELRDELTSRDPNLKVHVRAAVLSQLSEDTALCAWLERDKVKIDFLINNAGLGDRGAFVTGDPQRSNEMIAVNVATLTALTRALLPAMIAKRRGAILNISSSAGFLPCPGLAVYAATKAYVTSFSEAIRTELHGTGVVVTAVCPGPIETEFAMVAQRGSKRSNSGPKLIYVPVETAVRASLEAIERGKPVVVPGLVMKIAMLLVRVTPMPLLRLASRL